ncbi:MULTISPECIES: DUF461 domain-containing protein [unclassified Streptomyces]|uniref:DUF461 domain-containing protein n=1 Tax=unclassified Streptomyces TaxID=2593676 RepID=UPI002E1F3DE9|nr:DUF461 domain-containing protein [Streptomyces sp. NBC_01023]
MSSSLRRGVLAASAIVVSIAALSACGAGNNAATIEVKPDNAATSAGVIKVQNATVITQPKATAKGPAVISATLFNNGDTNQTLQDIKLAGSSSVVKLTPATGKGPISVPAHGSIAIGGKNNAAAVLADGRSAAADGSTQNLVFQFSETGRVTLAALVVPATSYFQGFGPSSLPVAPSTSATPSGSTTPSGTASPGASGKATPGAGGKATPGGKTSPGANKTPAGSVTGTPSS